MATDTSRPVVPPEHEAPRPSMTRTVVATVAAVVVTGFVIAWFYGVTEVYGPWTEPVGQRLLVVLAAAILPGLLLAWAIRLLTLRAGRHPLTSWLVAPLAVLAVAGASYGASELGGRAYQSDTAASVAACSAADLALLDGLPVPGIIQTPMGDPDGRCMAVVTVQGGPVAAMNRVDAAMATAGWTTTDPSATQRTYTKDGQVITVTMLESTSSGTDVRLTVPAG